MRMLWLDTDIGSDIDDAPALAYLLARDDYELIGLSTVTEVENQRARLAAALCGYARGAVGVELEDSRLLTPRREEPHEIAVTADADRFFEHLFSTFAGRG